MKKDMISFAEGAKYGTYPIFFFEEMGTLNS